MDSSFLLTAGHLIGSEPEPLVHDATLELGREEAVVTTQHEPGRHIGPCCERPLLLERRVGLLAEMQERFRGHRRR